MVRLSAEVRRCSGVSQVGVANLADGAPPFDSMRIVVIAISVACSVNLMAGAGQKKKSGKLEFDQVSLKRSSRPKLHVLRTEFTGGPGSADPTHLTIKGYDLFHLIERVYGVGYFEIS